MRYSILMPAYKARFLKEAVGSVLSQTLTDFELIVVDDCSPEDIAGIVNSFDDERVRYFRNEVNCGIVDVVRNWNICLEKSRGDYVICMGDDDALLPCCLQEMETLIGKYPGLGVYHLQTRIVGEDGEVLEELPLRPEYESAAEAAYHRFRSERKQFIGDFCFEAKRLLQEGGFYHMPLAWGSDDITSLRAAAYAGIANTQSVCFCYRENRDTISNSASRRAKLKTYPTYSRWMDGFISEQLERGTAPQHVLRSLSAQKRKYVRKLFLHELKCMILNK